MAILGRCSDPECGGDTVDYVCPECQRREIERLQALLAEVKSQLIAAAENPGCSTAECVGQFEEILGQIESAEAEGK